MGQSYFELLGLAWDASYTDVHAAYKRLREKWAKDPRRLQALEEAHKTLMDPGRRRAYMQRYESARLAGTLGEPAPPTAQEDTSASHTVQHGSPSDSHTQGDSDAGTGSRTGHSTAQGRAGQAPSGSSARQKTQYYEPVSDTPAPPAPDSGRPSSARSGQTPASRPVTSQKGAGRLKTEYFEPLVDTPSGSGSAGGQAASTPPQQAASHESRPEPPASSGGRQKTVLFDQSAVDPAPAQRVQTPSESNPGQSGSVQAQPVQKAGGQSGRRPPTEIYPTEPGGGQQDAGSHNDETRVMPDRDAGRPVGPAPRLARLHVHITYQDAEESFPLEEGDNLVGRPPRTGPSPAVPLPDPKQFISRRHALLRVDGDSCYVIDQGSDNGTYVNGRRLRPGEPYRLDVKNDVIRIEGRLLHVRPA